MLLELDRPLAYLDFETTGVNTKYDRIVELAIIKVYPDGRQERLVRRINPERTIPAGATAIHGITDADVADCPTFGDVALEVMRFISGCDLAGFAISRFDVPLLVEEFQRVGLTYDIKNVRIVDAQRIYHQKEPRTLSAALEFYCGEIHSQAHGAEADVVATMRVLQGQFARYDDLPHSVDELDVEFCPERHDALDPEGKLRWRDDEVVIDFGTKRGMTLRELAAQEASYLKWMLKKDFSSEAKDIVRNALAGTFPRRPN